MDLGSGFSTDAGQLFDLGNHGAQFLILGIFCVVVGLLQARINVLHKLLVKLIFLIGGFKLEVQHLPPIKVRRCRHLVRLTSSFNLKIASPLPA